MVAEDDETNYFYLKAILTRETELKILHASNGREAIELVKTNPWYSNNSYGYEDARH